MDWSRVLRSRRLVGGSLSSVTTTHTANAFTRTAGPFRERAGVAERSWRRVCV